MKKIIAMVVTALVVGTASFAQDSTAFSNRNNNSGSYDTIPNPSDTSANNRNWNKDGDKKKHKKDKKDWNKSDSTMNRKDPL